MVAESGIPVVPTSSEIRKDMLILVLLTLKLPNFHYLCTMKDEVKLYIYSADLSTELELPYADGGIKAGFPSPAQDYLTESIDLNKILIRHTETTFYAKVSGDSLSDIGISDGDLAVIDRSLEAQNGIRIRPCFCSASLREASFLWATL